MMKNFAKGYIIMFSDSICGIVCISYIVRYCYMLLDDASYRLPRKRKCFSMYQVLPQSGLCFPEIVCASMHGVVRASRNSACFSRFVPTTSEQCMLHRSRMCFPGIVCASLWSRKCFPGVVRDSPEQNHKVANLQSWRVTCNHYL